MWLGIRGPTTQSLVYGESFIIVVTVCHYCGLSGDVIYCLLSIACWAMIPRIYHPSDARARFTSDNFFHVLCNLEPLTFRPLKTRG